jgi:S-(hydroxymethyl)glutathione dehydrogenase/alcohol dehydrogenase
MKAAILVASEQPLVIDDIALSDHLEFGQVLVDVHYSGICGAQINEIDFVFERGTHFLSPVIPLSV